MKNQIVITIFLLSAFGCHNNPNSKSKSTASQELSKMKVYLLGTFHFAQTDSTYNVLDENHQKDIEELCNIIASVNPSKIFVERQPEYEFQNKIDSLFTLYKSNGKIRSKNEIYQVGFKLAKKLGHEKVYQCDHPGQYGRYNRAAIQYANENSQNDILSAQRTGTVLRDEDRINEDSIMHNSSLLEYLQWLNSDQVMRLSHGSYIANYPLIGSNNYYDYDDDNTLIGAELIADWYKRNIMIYTKMINQVNYEEEAIFLLMGTDHIPIIKNLFNGNPHFEVIEISEWLKK